MNGTNKKPSGTVYSDVPSFRTTLGNRESFRRVGFFNLHVKRPGLKLNW